MSDDKNNQTRMSGATQSQAIRSPFYRDTYANSFRFRLSPIDFTIVFSSNTDVLGANIQDEMGVNMSLPAAKILTLHLNNMIEALEREIGVIRIPAVAIPTEQVTQGLLRSIKENPLTDK